MLDASLSRSPVALVERWRSEPIYLSIYCSLSICISCVGREGITINLLRKESVTADTQKGMIHKNEEIIEQKRERPKH